MHELGLAMEVVDTVTARAGARRVRRVVLEIGALAAVLPDSLRFCFDLATAGTRAESASLELVLRPGVARCNACGTEVELERPYGLCRCGATDLEWLRGDELTILEMEVE